MLIKVISGGQTSVDRAARDCGLEIGGWCPPGRVCEAGIIPAEFPRDETEQDRSLDAPGVRRDGFFELSLRPRTHNLRDMFALKTKPAQIVGRGAVRVLRRPVLLTVLTLLAFSLWARTSEAGEFQTAAQTAVSNYETKAGARYRDIFTKAISSPLAAALGSCARGSKVERAEIVFIVSADGRVARVLSSPGVAFGRCLVSKLRLPATVPRPPRDSWPVIIAVAYNESRPGPPDKPVRLADAQLDAYDRAIAPYIAKARATYPAAKKRFLDRLPPGYIFSVWIRLYQKDNKTRQLRHEDVFVEVESIKNGVVSGRINNKILLLTNHRQGERISIPESEVKNWVILRPDGVEEGNPVGKFLDHYKPR